MFFVRNVTEFLSEEYDTNISVEHFELDFFNELSLKGLYVEDLQQDTLFYAHETSASFSFWKLFIGKIEINSIHAHGLFANLKTDESGNDNFSFLFKQKEKKEKRSFDFQLNVQQLLFNSSQIRYRSANALLPTERKFSSHDILVSDLNAEFALEHFSSDSVNVEVKSLSLTERSGFQIDDMTAILVANDSIGFVPEIFIKLPKSELSVQNINISYAGLNDLDDWAKDIHWDIPHVFFNLALSDLGAFAPPLYNMSGNAEFSGQINGSLDNLQIINVSLDYEGLPLVRGEAEFNGLPIIDETFVYADVIGMGITKNRLQDLISDYKDEPYLIPSSFDVLGDVRFSGNITGFLGNLVAFGTFRSGVGTIFTDVLLETNFDNGDLSYRGKVSANGFDLGRLLGSKEMGIISFSVQTNGGVNGETKHLAGRMKADVASFELKDYGYENIHAEGKYNNAGFDGELLIDDPNLLCRFNGLVDFTQKMPVLNFKLNVDSMKLHELNLTKSYARSNLSFVSSINLVGSSLDDINGSLVVDSILFENGEKSLAVNDFSIFSNMTGDGNKFIVQSDFMNASLRGKYKYSTLSGTVKKVFSQYLPSLFTSKEYAALRKKKSGNLLEFDIYFRNLDVLTHALDIQTEVPEISIIKGLVDEPKNVLDVQIAVPLIKKRKQYFEDFTFRFNNDDEQLHLSMYSEIKSYESDRSLQCYLKTNAVGDSIATHLYWNNNDSVLNNGSVNLNTYVTQTNDSVDFLVEIDPAYVVINDSIWQLFESTMRIKPHREIEINDFRFEGDQQLIAINGIAGKTQQDSVSIGMKNLQLDYFLNLIPQMNDSVTFGGKATGQGFVYSALDKPVFDAEVFLEKGSVNGCVLGDLNATAKWDREMQQVLFDGTLTKDTLPIAYADGVLIPKTDSVHFDIDAQGVDVGFINRYTQSFIEDFQGNAHGNITLFGNIKERRTHFTGRALVKNGSLGISELNTRYLFSDSITLTKTQILFDKIAVFDLDGNHAELNGEVNHDGTFEDFKFDINVACENILGLNTTIEDNDVFFGKVYATGTVRISGDEQETTVNVKAKTEAKSKFNVSLASASDAIDNSFITFNSAETEADSDDNQVFEEKNESSRMRLILQVEATPAAEMQVLIDPKTGDLITGRGTGNVRFELTPEDEMKLLGTYSLESGSYTFTLQNMLRRDFQIAQGSSISWTGDPFNAIVDIRALYNTTASLKDLQDEDLLRATSRINVPVSCILNLTDELMRPTIKFDFDLPNSDESIKERVRNIINTDEMMNRQIIYLLVFNKFYTPEYLQTATNNVGTNEAYSILTSTVTSQINNWISQLTTDFSFGFNIRPSYYEDEGASQEYETEFLYQPNSRLAINGNLGYRNDDINSQNVYGDIDIEYMLDRAGKLRAKAYTHSVDRYEYLADKSKQTMQGVGLVYKEEFNVASELFDTYLLWFKRIFTRENKKKKQDEVKE